jgi:hypothetical protein
MNMESQKGKPNGIEFTEKALGKMAASFANHGHNVDGTEQQPGASHKNVSLVPVAFSSYVSPQGMSPEYPEESPFGSSGVGREGYFRAGH